MITIHWDALYNWKFFPVLILVIIILGLNYKKRRDRLTQLVSKSYQKRLLLNYSPLRYLCKFGLFILGSLMLFITILRPQWGTLEEYVKQEGRDLVIALDVSRSMLAQDIKPNRLEFAKNKIRALVNRLGTERIALVLFAGTPVVQCPLTTDYKAFFMFLDQIDAQTISHGTTALDQAILKVINMFELMPDRKNKLLVILTDGEDFSSNLAEIKKKAADIGLHIFTLGIGTPEGAPVPIVDERGRITDHQKDPKGAVVISQLNEGILRTLAEDSGGLYYTATTDETDINNLVTSVERYEKEEFEDKKISETQDRYQLFAALSFLCFVLEWLL